MKTSFLTRAAAALLALTAAFAALAAGGGLRAAAATAEEAGAAAQVLISRSSLSPIPAGSEAQLTLSFENRGDSALREPVAFVTPSEGLTIWGEASSFALNEIPAGGTGSVSLTLRAAESATAAQKLVAYL